MKKIIVLLAAMSVAPAFAAATNVCLGASSAASVQVTKGTTPSGFILNDFEMKCSANVFLSYEASDVVVAVGSASKKGKNIFAGSSAGGAVAPTGACANQSTGCTAAEAKSAAETALAAAASGSS